LGIALMSFVESIASARAFAAHDDPPVDADQELFALGVANVTGGFTQAYPAGGGTSQTAVNDQAGAKSQIAQVVTAVVVMGTLLFLASLIGRMPQATLGALVLVAAAGLIKVGEFQRIARFRCTELGWALAALAGVVLLGTLQGIVAAVMLSMLVLIYYANRPLADHPDDATFPGLLLRSEGMLYFASAPRAIERYWAAIRAAQPRVVVLECSATPGIEYTALGLLSDFKEQLADRGVTLWLAALNPEALRAVEDSPLGQRLTHERMFFNLEAAVEAFVAA
jgi:MFS superfamily sulfate permease-like transporter